MKISARITNLHVMLPWLLLLIGAATLLPARAEDGERVRPRHRLAFFQLEDSVAYLQSTLYVSDKGERTDIAGAVIRFLAVTDTSETLVAEGVTDARGIATGIVEDLSKLWTDSLGTIAFVAEFRGNDLYKARDADVEIRALAVEVGFSEEDSTRTLEVTARNPVTGDRLEGVEMKVLVGRMFRPLKVGDLSTGRRGTDALEFPADIPGDVDGNLDIIVRMEDSDLYGNYTMVKQMAWGVPLEPVPHKIQRALWSPLAPLWMVLVFLILMGTVWGHYLVIVYMLNRMKSYRQGRTMIWE